VREVVAEAFQRAAGRRGWGAFALLATGFAVAVFVAAGCGRYGIAPARLFEILVAKVLHPASLEGATDAVVLFSLRLPRLAAAVLVGASLSAAGASYQAVFRNPMADPGILGVSAGAACGAAMGILLFDSVAMIQLLSFGGGLVAVFLAATIARLVRRDGEEALTLILSGIVVNALATALLSLAKYAADPDSKLPAITFWLMGGFSGVDIVDVRRAAFLMPPALLVLWSLRTRIDALSCGDEEALSLGVDPRKVRAATILASTLLAATAVSMAGLLGWVGILVPHMGRMLLGPGFARLLPCVVLLGATFLLVVDTSSRSVFALEVPLGILTALLGAPLFVALLGRGRQGWT